MIEIIFLLFSFAVIILFFTTFYLFAENVYGNLFHKPFYVHLYFFPKKLAPDQLKILEQQFVFYTKLPAKKKRYFEHRTATFIKKHQFYGKEQLVVSQEMKVLIAATSTMLTFGMRKYIYTVFDKIILYPDVYYSKTNQAWHKGEFNIKVKALVFSWKHFQQGYELANDNLNLGLHEFSHILQYQSLKSSDVSAVIYRANYEKLLKEVNHPPNYERLIASHYFRKYAFTNDFEFIAVILEHFFETPEIFKAHFPELYLNVRKMINYKEIY